MIIRTMRSYFLYNVPVTNHLMDGTTEDHIGVTMGLVQKMEARFEVTPTAVPAFYTNHYRTEHTPYTVHDTAVPRTTTIPAAKLNAIDFYQTLQLGTDVHVQWDFVLALQTTGLITICLEMTEPQDSDQAYRLSGLHLNPAYQVIDTEPIHGLWAHNPQARPPFVTLDELAQAIHTHFFQAVGVSVRRFRALRHELQIPFTAVEVETSAADQDEFISRHSRELAELVFKPACWEVEHASTSHTRHVLDETRLWSLAQDTLVITAYEGTVYVKIRTFDTGVPYENSGFYVADESAVLHSFKVAVSNYYLLRILDDLIDREMPPLKTQTNRYQKLLHASFNANQMADNEGLLREMNDFVIRVTNLGFELVELKEELDNPDKLIDEEWHIVLLTKLNDSLGVKAWVNGLHQRIHNLRELVQTVEHTFQRLLDLNMSRSIYQINLEAKLGEDREKLVGLVFGAFAIAELFGLLISLLFDDQHPLVVKMGHWFGVTISASHALSTAMTSLIILLVLYPFIRYMYRRDK